MATERVHGMYRFRYTTTERSNARVLESQLWFIGEDEDNYYFSARPYAGTQDIPKRRVEGELKKITNSAGVYIGRDPRKRRTPRYVRSMHFDPR